MKVVLLSLLCFTAFAILLYVFAGRILRSGPPGRLARTARICFWSYLAAAALTILCVRAIFEAEVARPVLVVLIYAVPLLFTWGVVAGASWLEVRAYGVPSGLWRFHRFNLLSGFMAVGQRVPFFSAAVAVPAQFDSEEGFLLLVLLHLLIATGIGWAARWVVTNRIVSVRPFPDQRLAVEVRRVAQKARIRLRGVLLVATEPGQFVNAIAATTSHFIFVAEGLWKGLDREEVRAVLLHEVGHLGQTAINAVRAISLFFWPALLWGLRVVGVSSPDVKTALLHAAGLLLIGLAGSGLMYLLSEASERKADRFAEEHGTPGMLASALRKLHGDGAALQGGPDQSVLDRLAALAGPRS
jgi:Zn-dependent protease with chaperone function